MASGIGRAVAAELVRRSVAAVAKVGGVFFLSPKPLITIEPSFIPSATLFNR
jgi:hypothetical protein